MASPIVKENYSRRSILKTKWLIFVCSILLYLWLTLGRAFLGSIGWTTVIMIASFVPVVFLGLTLLLITSVTPSQRSASRSPLTKLDTSLLALLAMCIFLYGLFLVDFGDTSDSANSVAINLFGKGFEELSANLAAIFLFSSVFFYIATLVAMRSHK